MSFGIASVAAISVIAYLVGLAAKNIKTIGDKWIPVICGSTGAVLGIVGFLTNMPDFPATDIVTAIAVGIVSGMAATGADQIIKQIKRGDKSEGDNSKS